MPAKKALMHKAKHCNSEYEVLFTDSNVPYLRCSGCNHELRDWIKWEEEYSKYHEEPSRWNTKDLPMSFLGLFCSLYKQHYEQAFSMSLNERGLFAGQEFNIVRRVLNNLSSDPTSCKDYIVWFFSEKVAKRKRALNSLAILASPEMLNEFKTYQKKQTIITRDRIIPDKMLEWIRLKAPAVLEQVSLHDYGDMYLLLSAYSKGQFQIPDMKIMIEKFQAIGLIDQDLKIRNWRGE